ncbi:MAG: adenosylcobinamide-GDP ribazoletransferase [Roseburia sp.]|nr:adenosylcobinamide-GDP ribazoletransferase [Ruminococcus sp.]MCM1155056.1 adenosylcobinamide-GDP ribazoletransferase [Roseburia sp.]MCM1241559.1 adenosylcobinamide-GDP ribazoletransferase [Roseburia sp.]
MKPVLSGFLAALGRYSFIPVPTLKKSKETIPYMLCFLPIIGAVTGLFMCGYAVYCAYYISATAFFALTGSVIPILLSKGTHLCGFMKTWDALGMENGKPAGRIARMEEDRAGVSAVAAAMSYYLLYAGGLSCVEKEEQLFFLGTGYVISRTLFSMAFVWFPTAGRDSLGMGALSKVQKQNIRITLGVILALCFGTCIAIRPVMGVLMSLLCMWVWTYYFYMSKKRFGGVTEETSGYFLTLCELAVVLFIAVFAKTGI